MWHRALGREVGQGTGCDKPRAQSDRQNLGCGRLGGEGGAGALPGAHGLSGHSLSSCPYFSFDSAAGDSPQGSFPQQLKFGRSVGVEEGVEGDRGWCIQVVSGALGAE